MEFGEPGTGERGGREHNRIEGAEESEKVRMGGDGRGGAKTDKEPLALGGPGEPKEERQGRKQR